MEILNFTPSSTGMSEVATFDLDFGEKWGFGFSRIKLRKGRNGGYFISFPSYKVGSSGTSQDWKNFLYTYGNRGKEFTNHVMDLLKPEIEKLERGNITSSLPTSSPTVNRSHPPMKSSQIPLPIHEEW